MANTIYDFWVAQNYLLPSALYYYYIGEDVDDYSDAKEILGNCSAILSVQYVPFLQASDFNLNKVTYDKNRFGSNDELRPPLPSTMILHRINTDPVIPVKTLGSFKCYKPEKSIGGSISWKNESRLYNYPYNFAMLTDHLNSPLEIQYHLCSNQTSEIKVLNTLSDRCSYGLFVDGYKGDDGKMEALVSSDSHELPCSSSAYSQWYATSKNQINQNLNNSIQNAFLQNQNIGNNFGLSLAGNIIGGGSSALSGDIIGGIGGSVLSGLSSYVNAKHSMNMNNVSIQQQIANNMATAKDVSSTPATMLSMGSDVYYGLAKGEFKLELYRYGLTNEYYKKLGDYFALYGYKQNKIMNINRRSRHYYNYIKTIGVNIKADTSEGIPRQHLDQIKAIYDRGVTMWHIDREDVVVGDYTNDNYEV